MQGAGVDPNELDTRLRLVLHSFLEDGEYARELFDRIFERVHPLFAASIEAATAAGDLKPGSIASANRFWFGQHVAAMVAFVLADAMIDKFGGDSIDQMRVAFEAHQRWTRTGPSAT